MMLPTGKETDRQTDERRVTHNNLLSGGNVCVNGVYVTSDELWADDVICAAVLQTSQLVDARINCVDCDSWKNDELHSGYSCEYKPPRPAICISQNSDKCMISVDYAADGWFDAILHLPSFCLFVPIIQYSINNNS